MERINWADRDSDKRDLERRLKAEWLESADLVRKAAVALTAA